MSTPSGWRDHRRLSLPPIRWEWPWRTSAAATRADPAARMFSHIRLRMALWYSAILGVILVLAGVLLFFGMQRVLLAPVLGQLRAEAHQQAISWQRQGNQAFGCSPGAHLPAPYLVSCYDATGRLLSANLPPYLPTSVASAALARTALAAPSAGTATDTVTVQSQAAPGPGPGPGQSEVGDGAGTIQQTILRYAAAVEDPSSGQPLGVVEIGLDITGETHALNTLLMLLLSVGGLTLLVCGVGGAVLAARALAPARLAFARQQAFIADASHELRTPLTLLRANAEVLLRGRARLPAEDAPLLDDIVAEVEHMSGLAENLLLLARLDAGSARPEREVVNLGEIASAVARQLRALAEERAIRLDLAAAGEVLVLGDPAQLREVALILVDNATKYNRPGGSVTVRAYANGGRAVLDVRDTGIGISAEHLKRLGERFYRVEKARSRQMGARGWGSPSRAGSPWRTTARLAWPAAPARARRRPCACPRSAWGRSRPCGHTSQRARKKPRPPPEAITRHHACAVKSSVSWTLSETPLTEGTFGMLILKS